MSLYLRARTAVAVAVLMTLLMALPASAITYGERDEEDEYPYVVVVYIFVEIDGVTLPAWGCSGSVVQEDLVLSVAHCTGEFVPGLEPAASWVLFGNDLSDFGQLIPHMLDPDFDVSDPPSVEDLSIDRIVTGTPKAHPEFDGFADFPQTYDIGVVELHETVSESDYGPFPEIAPPGYLDELDRDNPRSGIDLTVVGYGDQRVQVTGAVIDPVTGEPSLTTEHTWDGWRHFGSASLVNLRSSNAGGHNMQISGNAGTNGSGTCYGDSGGPILHGDTIVGLTSFGIGNPMCRGNTNFAYRADTEAALDFLDVYRD